MIISATLTLLASTTGGTLDYPIDPVPLRNLCETADVIFIGTAGNPEPITPKDPDDFATQAKVRLKLEACLLGGVQDASVTIRYTFGLLCPTPARFEAGNTYLVFAEAKENGQYRSIALSYGVKEVQPLEVISYAKAVKEWVAIQELKDDNAKRVRTLEWLVQLCENPHTRWEGAIEFNDQRNLPTGSSRSFWVYNTRQLLPKQLDRMCKALGETRTIERGDLELYRALRFNKDPDVTRFLIRYLKNFDQRWLSKSLLLDGFARVGSKEAQALFDEFWTTSSSGILHFKGDSGEKLMVREIGRILEKKFEADLAKKKEK